MFKNINVIEEDRNIGINEVIKHNEIINKFKTVNIKWNLIVWGVKNIQKNIHPTVLGSSNGKAMILSKCSTCGSKNSRFSKNQPAKGLLSNLGLRIPLTKVPILGDLCFEIIKWMN